MDFEKMWNDLKKYLEEGKNYYKKGVMCSLSESTWGEEVCSDILKEMEEMEKKENGN